ncbi:hypothetical protein MKW94_023735 [Papaver nudicaule]|uniref:RNA cytidine acetyltransferase n=1 Tax=Papaver nudicaule TaxID=74823 RepID=A0AA41VC84_PAPNU|nr:hypothetical protein [Papaver nudicaule]
MRKKVDNRIRTLIENGVKTRHRCVFFIVGDKCRNQIVHLHNMYTKSVVVSQPKVLWCYKDKLELSSHEKKRKKQILKLVQTGSLDSKQADVFEFFARSVEHCKYEASERILGREFSMCILQDFEALTPNILARTIETVKGGGLVVLLLRSLPSLTSLYSMAMDVHERFRTASHFGITPRFNERFLLSLAYCRTCVVMDDELNILPISSHIKSIEPVAVTEGLSEARRDLKSLQEQLNGDFPVGPILNKCLTFDQGKALISFLDAILEKTLRSTVALLAARGRGKSAALGLAIAGAVAAGYSNIFVTAPVPENVKTLFQFVCRGFDALGYVQHMDYDLVERNKAIVRITINKHHKQTIRYIRPNEHEKLSTAELLVIDEAAAIPFPMVKSLFGPYLIFLSSTVNGYEGSGRSLSLKLLQQLEEQSQNNKSLEGSLSGRHFKKVELKEAIRYAPGDPVESWLHGLLCLDATTVIPDITSLPLPSECDLYYVNRDTLFSRHKDSELFLQRMMALYVSSHHKNSPDDLQLMADAPAHHLFVLLGPVDKSNNQLPDILCVIQVCLEGQISHESVSKSLSDGHLHNGDEIPWKFSEQFRDTMFPSLSGARIVRIAVHPSAMKLGYGSIAVELLTRYYEGQLTSPDVSMEKEVEETHVVSVTEAAGKVSLLEETIKPRSDLPHLLMHLSERRPEKLHYIGVFFGLTLELFRFWRKHKFTPFYICQTPNDVTGEYTCMVIKPLANHDTEASGSDEWGFLSPFYQDFRRRFARLLGSCFKAMECKLAMGILDAKINFVRSEPNAENGFTIKVLSPHDLNRLKAYTSGLVDVNMILDLLPTLARKYFREKLPITLSPVQASLLLCTGLQNQDITSAERQLKLNQSEILKTMRKFFEYLNEVAGKEIESTLPSLKKVEMLPHKISLDDDLNAAAKQVMGKMKAETEGALNPELLQRYAIVDREAAFEEALRNGSGKIGSGGVISVKSTKQKKKKEGKWEEVGDSRSSSKKRVKDDTGSRLHKKKKN